MRNHFIDSYDDIRMSEQLEENILNQTVYKTKKKSSKKIIYACFACLAFTVMTMSGVRADIEPIPPDLSTTRLIVDEQTEIVLADHLIMKDIKDDAKKVYDEDPDVTLTYDELEAMLGIELLQVKGKNPSVDYHPAMNEVNGQDEIAMINLLTKNMAASHDSTGSQEDRYLSVHTTILTDKACEAYQYTFIYDMDIMGEKVVEEIVHSSHLDVDVVFYSYGFDKGRMSAIFAYDDVLYQISADGFTIEELKAMIEEME